MNTCKNLCNELKVKKDFKHGMYDKYKFCKECNEFFKTYETFCLCCGTHLRMKAKSLSSDETEGKK